MPGRGASVLAIGRRPEGGRGAVSNGVDEPDRSQRLNKSEHWRGFAEPYFSRVQRQSDTQAAMIAPPVHAEGSPCAIALHPLALLEPDLRL